jgi:small subunit ribosomal protein S11
MGKKKIGTQTAEEAINQASAIEGAVVASAGKNVAKKIDKGCVFVKASYNNTIISVTDEKGNLVAWSTAGALGFRGPKKATPFAASKVVAALTEKLRKAGLQKVNIYLNGIGGGRDSSVRSFVNQGFDVLGIHDVTPIPHNGPKPKKVRRI